MSVSVLYPSQHVSISADLCDCADVWTVNKRAEMIEATKWGAKAILTDRTAEFLQLRQQMESAWLPLHIRLMKLSQLTLANPSADWSAVSSETTWRFAWTSIWYSSLANVRPSSPFHFAHRNLTSLHHLQYILAEWERYLLTSVGGPMTSR